MLLRFFAHLRGNVVAYLALFIALGGSSYAAVRLTPNSVTTKAIARRAVTGAKLAPNSVTSTTVKNGALNASDFKPGTFIEGLKGDTGDAGPAGSDGLDGLSLKGDAGPAGPEGPEGAKGDPGHDGSASIALKARAGGGVSAPHGAQTNVPLSGATWTQGAGQVNLITGSVDLTIPSSCTGSLGNTLIISVDGQASTVAIAPMAPAGTRLTMPLVVGTLSEPDNDTAHTMTASFANSCARAGEDYGINGAKLDVLAFG